MILKVLTAVTIKITILWYATPFNLVDTYQRFGTTCFLLFSTLMVEVAASSETLVPIYESISRHIQEDCHDYVYAVYAFVRV
jgi:hypothetical protein